MYELIIFNKNKTTIKLKYAKTFTQRLRGLMLKHDIKPILFIQSKLGRYNASIHTHFMLKTIDIIFINKNNIIKETVTLKPWKIYIPKTTDIKYIIELPKNTIQKQDITTNTKIELVIKDEK